MKLGLSLAALVASAGLASAQAPSPEPGHTATDGPAAAPARPAAKATTHKVQAEVVSTDVEKKTITVKVDGAEKTEPVGPLAMFRLKKLKTGDKVILTYRDDGDEISFIRMAPPAVPASPGPGGGNE
jgi:hypothetical protein